MSCGKPVGSAAHPLPNPSWSHEVVRFPRSESPDGTGNSMPDTAVSIRSVEYLKSRLRRHKQKCSPRRVSIFYPLFYQGDVRWENQFRRNRNRQNFVVGSYFLTGLESSENPAHFFRS